MQIDRSNMQSPKQDDLQAVSLFLSDITHAIAAFRHRL
ncbi:hypothetical protein NIES2104_32410 [Leptolyngbya sp. NIES-2104]|nr:hypothetical protein NIES2104_32410 [Leptolyngbya sp. NIES-2104]